MDRKQKSKVRMFLAVQQVCNKYQSELGTVPMALMAFNQYSALIGKIQDAFQLQELDYKGITLAKSQAREWMAQQAFVIAKALSVLALKSGNPEMLEQINYSRTEIGQGSEIRAKEICDLILIAAMKYEADLQPFGIDSADISDLNDAIEAFSGKLGKPRLAVATRKRATSQIARFISEASNILVNELDALMFQFEGTDFFKEYSATRIIIDPGTYSPKEESGPEAEDGQGPITLQ